MAKEHPPFPLCRAILSIFLTAMILVVVLLVCLLQQVPGTITLAQTPRLDCPDQVSGFIPFPPSSPGDDVVLNGSQHFLLSDSVTVNTIHVLDGAVLVIADRSTKIYIRTKYIWIENGGSLYIGSETCPYMSDLDIALYGKSTDIENVSIFGQKFIGVAPTGSIDIHGPWKLSWTMLTTTITPGIDDVIIGLTDNAATWNAGDVIVIASSDYDMNHAERFVLIDCPACSNYQIKIKGPIQFYHCGDMTAQGVDVRAEVGILTRNIKIHGIMSDSCYGDNKCNIFNYDTFGGQIKVLNGAVNARFEGIELFNMGQQILGSYPIHFHRLFSAHGKYARQLSIYDSFSRCVTLHAVQGAVVEDVVGLNSLGHCFFLEDGNERNNTLRHNLGLVTKSATLLPSDRNHVTCRTLTAHPTVYMPNPDLDCKGTATFWISHPSNNCENNAAAGSEQVGFFYAFYREPTGQSVNTLPFFHGERSPLMKFSGNRAHSNPKAGLFMDRGVKITDPSPDDPRDFLALTNIEKYAPHVDRNLSLPRVTAEIYNFTGFLNTLGVFVRGGDISINAAKLSDNDVAVQMASSSTLPYDVGSHQQLINSVVVGRSLNNSNWPIRNGSCVGVQIRDGPILVDGNSFYNFVPTSHRNSYAIGFYPNYTGQMSPGNIVGYNSFDHKSQQIYFEPTGFKKDGDLTRVLYDSVGSLTGSRGSYIIGPNNPLLMTPSCQNSTSSPSVVFCINVNYVQLFVNVSSLALRLNIRETSDTNDNSTGALTFTGVKEIDTLSTNTTSFVPLLIAKRSYRFSWLGGTAPSTVDLSMFFSLFGDYVELEICYPPNTTFNISSRNWDQTLDVSTAGTLIESSDSMGMYQTSSKEQYYWNNHTSLLYVRMVNSWQTTMFNYCPSNGCHYITIAANVKWSGQFSCFM